MLEKSLDVTFFLKTPEKKENLRVVYLRVTVDSIPKEISTKRSCRFGGFFMQKRPSGTSVAILDLIGKW